MARLSEHPTHQLVRNMLNNPNVSGATHVHAESAIHKLAAIGLDVKPLAQQLLNHPVHGDRYGRYNIGGPAMRKLAGYES